MKGENLNFRYLFLALQFQRDSNIASVLRAYCEGRK